MSEAATESTTDETASETSADTSTETEATSDSATEADDKSLGDAGKKALDAMKAKWKDADKLAKENAATMAALQARLDGKEAEHAAEQTKRETEQAALAKANGRILRSEVKAAAKGVLADPADAYKFLDLDEFEVDDDGEVDTDAIAKALDDLVKTKPYLAVQDGKRFQGGADGGTRKESGPAQLSDADVKRLMAEGKHAEVEKARVEGRLNDLLGIGTR
jgi:hypothetical protein